MDRLEFLNAAWPKGNKSAIGVPGCISRVALVELGVKEFLRTLGESLVVIKGSEIASVVRAKPSTLPTLLLSWLVLSFVLARPRREHLSQVALAMPLVVSEGGIFIFKMKMPKAVTTVQVP